MSTLFKIKNNNNLSFVASYNKGWEEVTDFINLIPEDTNVIEFLDSSCPLPNKIITIKDIKDSLFKDYSVNHDNDINSLTHINNLIDDISIDDLLYGNTDIFEESNNQGIIISFIHRDNKPNIIIGNDFEKEYIGKPIKYVINGRKYIFDLDDRNNLIIKNINPKLYQYFNIMDGDSYYGLGIIFKMK